MFGTKTVENPYLVPVTATWTPFTFCVECDKPDLLSRAHCKRWLKALELEALPAKAAARQDCPGRPHHRVVDLCLGRATGSRVDGILAALLQQVEPALEEQVERFRAHRRLANPEILGLLVDRFGDGYPRLVKGDRLNLREILEGLVRDIAHDLERVVITEVDWRPLLGALHFAQKVKR